MIEKLKDLYVLNENDIHKANDLLARAFFEDPGIVYGFRKAEDRMEKTKIMWEMTLKDRIRYGEVYAPTEKLEGVALWLHSDFAFMDFKRVLQSQRFRNMIKLISSMKNGMKMQNIIDNTHKNLMKEPHMYLSTFAVDPTYQGKGYASKMMRPMIARCNEQKLKIYLETATEKDVSLYLHYGFEIVKEMVIDKDMLIMNAMVYIPK